MCDPAERACETIDLVEGSPQEVRVPKRRQRDPDSFAQFIIGHITTDLGEMR